MNGRGERVLPSTVSFKEEPGEPEEAGGGKGQLMNVVGLEEKSKGILSFSNLLHVRLVEEKKLGKRKKRKETRGCLRTSYGGRFHPSKR